MTSRRRAWDRLVAQRTDTAPARGTRPQVVQWVVATADEVPDSSRAVCPRAERRLRPALAGSLALAAVAVGAVVVAGSDAWPPAGGRVTGPSGDGSSAGGPAVGTGPAGPVRSTPAPASTTDTPGPSSSPGSYTRFFCAGPDGSIVDLAQCDRPGNDWACARVTPDVAPPHGATPVPGTPVLGTRVPASPSAPLPRGVFPVRCDTPDGTAWPCQEVTNSPAPRSPGTPDPRRAAPATSPTPQSPLVCVVQITAPPSSGADGGTAAADRR